MHPAYIASIVFISAGIYIGIAGAACAFFRHKLNWHSDGPEVGAALWPLVVIFILPAYFGKWAYSSLENYLTRPKIPRAKVVNGSR